MKEEKKKKEEAMRRTVNKKLVLLGSAGVGKVKKSNITMSIYCNHGSWTNRRT